MKIMKKRAEINQRKNKNYRENNKTKVIPLTRLIVCRPQARMINHLKKKEQYQRLKSDESIMNNLS